MGDDVDLDWADCVVAATLDALDETDSARLPVVLWPKEAPDLSASARERPVVARCREQVLEAVSRFLHLSIGDLSVEQRKALEICVRRDPTISGKRVLIVDDDVRNLFAIAAVLEQHDVLVSHAENGRDALQRLAEGPCMDAVLMDVMMPEMDGYEATRRIRAQPQYDGLPVIALTAKAMKGDREKCLDSGASDYITKPVEPEQLLSLLRVWCTDEADSRLRDGT